MTGRHRPSLDQIMADSAVDRAQLLAHLDAEKPKGRWLVVRQYNHLPEHQICSHRFEWFADLCAYRRTARHADEVGVHFTVRRAG